MIFLYIAVAWVLLSVLTGLWLGPVLKAKDTEPRP